MPHKLYVSLYNTIGFSIASLFQTAKQKKNIYRKKLQLYKLHLSVCLGVHENYITYNSLS